VLLRLRFVPVEFVKLNSVTVVEAALRFPESEREVPVAFVKRIAARFESPVTPSAVAVAFVAPSVVTKKDVEVAFVVVAFVKIAAAGVVRPIATALMVPPASVTLPLERFVTREFVEKKFVDVVFVPVAFVHVMLVGLNEPAVRFVKAPSTAKRRLPVALLKLRVPTVLDPAAKLPVSVRFDPVADVKVAVCNPVVPVTVRFEIVAPP
jgi:hypothetical protein